MDQACFEVWLEGIRSLTAEQRGLGFCELALAEAAEDSDLAVCVLPRAVQCSQLRIHLPRTSRLPSAAAKRA